jgi:hypothetical protein
LQFVECTPHSDHFNFDFHWLPFPFVGFAFLFATPIDVIDHSSNHLVVLFYQDAWRYASLNGERRDQPVD